MSTLIMVDARMGPPTHSDSRLNKHSVPIVHDASQFLQWFHVRRLGYIGQITVPVLLQDPWRSKSINVIISKVPWERPTNNIKKLWPSGQSDSAPRIGTPQVRPHQHGFITCWCPDCQRDAQLHNIFQTCREGNPSENGSGAKPNWGMSFLFVECYPKEDGSKQKCPKRVTPEIQFVEDKQRWPAKSEEEIIILEKVTKWNKAPKKRGHLGQDQVVLHVWDVYNATLTIGRLDDILACIYIYTYIYIYISFKYDIEINIRM